jgi:alpha-beta hydrolase superfamily lysophospholipase
MTTESRGIWWQLDAASVQVLIVELQAAAKAVSAAADELVRRSPSGAGLAVEAQRSACQELAAQARTAAECLAQAAEVWRAWLLDFEARRQERAAAADLLSRDLGRPAQATPDEVRQALAALRAGTHVSLLTSGLLAVAYQRLREIDDRSQAADDVAARRIAGLFLPTVPMTAWDPLAVALWWRGLLPLQREGLLRASAAELGAMNGLPISVRNAENRRLLAIATGTGNGTAGRLQPLAGALRRPGATLLAFDPHGDGTAVIALGDLTASRHVAVLVPGMSNEIDDIGRLVEAATALLAAARPGDGLAVVAWLGYDTPRVSQVASARLATVGADRLTSFVRSLRITAPDADVTVIGHSYGTLVAGEAAQHGMAADRLVFVGSPGVDATRATELSPAGQVWAARAPDDPIRLVFGTEQISRFVLGGPFGMLTLRKLRVDRFGPDPISRGFHAKRFSVAGSHGHSDYFRQGSTSVRNITRIATGRPADRR